MKAPFCAVAIALAVCGAARPGAQNQKIDVPLIEWSEGRKLVVADFKGNIPSRGNGASLSSVLIEVAWECREGTAASHARAVFDPNGSWWRDASPNLWQNADDASLLASGDEGGRALLEHEQLHFDMTEVWARRIRDAFKTLPAACRTSGGPRGFEKVITDIEREWQEEQQRYDRETGHGTDASRQRAWMQKVAKALRDTYATAAR